MQFDSKVLSIDDGPIWDEFVVAHPLGRALATSDARHYWRKQGWMLDAVGVLCDGKLVGLATVLSKKLALLPWALVRIEALMPATSNITTVARHLLDGVHALALAKNAVEIETRCRIPVPTGDATRDHYDGIQEALTRSQFVETKTCRRTYMVRIDLDEEMLLASYSTKCRRDVRKGLREGVQVKCLTENCEGRMFFDALDHMYKRKGLDSEEPLLFDEYWPLIKKGYFRLFGAFHDGRICNAALVEAIGVPRYTLGATLPAAFEKGTPPTGQLLHHGIMMWCRDHGASVYDLGGSPGPIPEEGHPNFTVWRFKHEFGGPFVYMMPYHLRQLRLIGGQIPNIARRFGRLQM